MKRHNYISAVAVAIFLLMMASCVKEPAARSVQLNLETDQIEVKADGGVYLLGVEADQEWVVSCDREWCTVSPMNGNGPSVCEISVDSSYLYSEREAHITFRSEGRSRQVTVNQFGYEMVIVPEVSEVEVPDFTDYGQMFANVGVRANVGFDILVEYQDLSRTGWISVKKQMPASQSIPRSGSVRVDYKMYTESDADRVARIVFRQNDAPEGVSPVESSVVFRQKRAQEIYPSRQGDSLTLLTLSRMMHISESWDVSQPMIHWKNVVLKDRTYFNEKLGEVVTEPRVVKVSFAMFDTNEGIPYHVRYLDQLEELYFTANSNAHIKRIDLGESVCMLSKLKVLSLVGYGISSLPSQMKQMVALEELELSGNNFSQIPMDVISALDKHNLWYVNLSNNRRRDVFSNLYANRAVSDTLGLHGSLPEELFRLQNVRYIGLSYNYLEGSVPDMGYDAGAYATLQEKIDNNPVMPQLEQLSLNLNYFTGNLPDWILYHPNLRCWDPYTLVFNQYEYAKDSNGRRVGFENEPSSVQQACHLWDEDNVATYSRANTFDPSVMYETLRNGTVKR